MQRVIKFRYYPRLDELERREAPSLVLLSGVEGAGVARGQADAPASSSAVRPFTPRAESFADNLSWLNRRLVADVGEARGLESARSAQETARPDLSGTELFTGDRPQNRAMSVPQAEPAAVPPAAVVSAPVPGPQTFGLPAPVPAGPGSASGLEALWSVVNAGGGIRPDNDEPTDGGGGGTLFDGGIEQSLYINSTNLSGATAMAWAPDGSNRLFVTRQTGQVRIVQNGQLLATPFATLNPVFTTFECGVIGIAFDPDYLSNRYVYLFVTVSSTEQQIIRYIDDNNIGTNKTPIITGLPTRGLNHNGGAVGFGIDGKLYWAIGDLGNGTGVNQNLTSLAAKVGRANRDGSVPGDNPFHDGPGPNNDYIWARGLRNPFTFSVQPYTQQLVVNSVGTSYEQVFVMNAGDHAGYNMYENNQPAGFLSPIIKYRTNGTDSRTITTATRSGGVATFTHAANNLLFRRGEKITINNVANPSFNGQYFVVGTPTATSFSVAQAGPNATSSGGTATTLNIGGCLTGGAFYNSNLLPAEYFNNYFFTDCNSGRVIRSTLDPDTNAVTSVDYFSRPVTNSGIDTEQGPDGAFYVLYNGGQIYRYSYTQTAQRIIVSPQISTMDEGGGAVINVRLAVQPTEPVAVDAFLLLGDTDTFPYGGPLVFTPENWATPQPLYLYSVPDADADYEFAFFAVYAEGLPVEWALSIVRDLYS